MLQRSIRRYTLIHNGDVLSRALTRAALKDFEMYQDELRCEAKLIAQGHQLIVQDAVALWRWLARCFGMRS